MGDVPSSTGDADADPGWHHVNVGPLEPAPFGRSWHAELWLHEPAADGWQYSLKMLARQAQVGLSRIGTSATLDRHERQQRALVEAGKALSSERSLDGVLHRIVELAMNLTGARYGALGVLDADQQQLASFVTVGIDAETQARIGELPTGRGLLGVLIDDPRPLRLSRLQDHARSVGFPEHHPTMKAFLGVPIVTSRDIAGRIYLTHGEDGREFSAEDEQLVVTLATQAAIAIDNAAVNEQLHRVAVQLAEASRHKSAFLANVSHELRSPLNTIIGYTRLLLEDPRSLDEEQVEDLQLVRGSGEHLLSLITELLDLQRIESGRVLLVHEPVDVPALVETVVASVRPSVADDVQIVADCSELVEQELVADHTRMRQILLNLLGNAVKFTSVGSVTLVARDAGDMVEFEVRDTGPGIPEVDQARIFDSFFQSQAALDRTPGPREGVGLGLAITRMLTELHGGTVHLQSTLGEGTAVTVRIPRDCRAASIGAGG